MTVNKAQLKALAEAATPGEWGYSGDYIAPTRSESGATYVEAWRSIGQAKTAEDIQFIAAANPATVLALLSEIERIELISRISCNHDAYMAVLSERDQLKAENEALRQDAERYRFIRQGQMIEGESCSEGLCLDLWDAEGAGQMLVLEEADQAIDAAMAGERHYVH